MEKKKHGWIVGMFMAGGIVMGAFVNVFENVFSGKDATTISRLENQKKHGHEEQESGDNSKQT